MITDFINGMMTGFIVLLYSFLIPYLVRKGWQTAAHKKELEDE